MILDTKLSCLPTVNEIHRFKGKSQSLQKDVIRSVKENFWWN